MKNEYLHFLAACMVLLMPCLLAWAIVLLLDRKIGLRPSARRDTPSDH